MSNFKPADEKIMVVYVANRMWREAKEASANHPFLVSRNIPACGARQYEEMLLVPAASATGRIASVQAIGENGNALFMPGSPVKGQSFMIGDYHAEPDKKVILCSDYASGVSIHLATQCPTLVAFASWNYKNVIREHEALDRSRIILADSLTNAKSSKFRSTAEDAVTDFGCLLLRPVFRAETIALFKLRGIKAKTWNDLHIFEGTEAVKAQLSKATMPSIHHQKIA